MATNINDMNPVYDGMGNLISSNEPLMSSIMPPIPETSALFYNPDNDSGRTSGGCKNYSFYIDTRSFKTKKSGFSHTPDSPWYDSNIEYRYGTEAQEECQIWVDVYRCCNDNGVKERIGEVLVARSKQTSFWLDCQENGKKGKKIRVQQFILLDELYGFYRETLIPDNTFISNNRGFRLPSPEDFVWGECPLQTRPVDYATYLRTIRQSFNIQPTSTVITQAKTSDSGNKVNVIPWSQGLLSWTTDPTGRDGDGNPTWDVIYTGCMYDGPCELTKEEPGNPPDFPYCITIDAIETVRELDAGTNTTVPGRLSRRGTPRYEVNDRGQVIVLTSLEELLEYNATRTVLENTRRPIPGTESFRNLVDIGFPCEREKIADYQVDVETKYVKLKICYRTDGAILITGGLGDFTAYITTQPASKGVSIPNTREYDPASNCCQDAEFFPDYAPDDPNVSFIPPANRSRLQFDMSTAEWILLESCGCEEVQIADVYCYYGDKKIGLAYRKDVKNTITHIKRREIIDPRCVDEESPKVFHPLDRKKDVIQGRRKYITKGLFNNQENLLCYLTSSTQPTESKAYYYDITDCDNCGRDPYFAVSYGHYAGSGSIKVDQYQFTKSPTDSVYSQYQLICLDGATYTTSSGHTLPKFSFVSQSTDVESDDVYVMNFYRNGLSDRLDAGNFQINMSYLSGSFYANNYHTGSNVKVGSPFVMSFIDDSGQYNEGMVCDGGELVSFNLVSGSLNGGVYENASVNTYGKVYPQIGVILLHPKRLNEILGFNTVTGSNIAGDNAFKLLTSISGAASPTTGRTENHYMAARNITYKTSTHYFVRVFPNYTNYSNNPTFVSSSLNQIFDKCFIDDPQTYITSVGLYDSDRQLIAIAKLSKPVKKNFDTDLVIKIRLNW